MKIDPRAGSKELLVPLRAAGLPAELELLPAGDIELVGRGCGRPMSVGVEYKSIPDMLQCSRDGRFAEQLRAMRARYEVSWLLLEGEWRYSPNGPLEVMESRGFRAARAGHTYQEVVAWHLTMIQRGGVLLWQTRDRTESVAWLRSLYWWWMSKDFEEHRAHLDWYTPPYCPDNAFDRSGPSVTQKVAAALLAAGPTVDVNSTRAKAAAAHFPSVRAMVTADETEWRAVEGIGAKIAKRVVEAVK